MLSNDEANRVDCIDFTIGDPKIEWTTSDGKKHNWEEVWSFVGSKNFVASLPKDVTIRVYEDCLGNDNRAFLSKNSKDFKYVGKQNGKQMVEITLCSDDAFSTAGETDADDEDDERETKRKRLKKQTREEEEEEAMERDWLFLSFGGALHASLRKSCREQCDGGSLTKGRLESFARKARLKRFFGACETPTG